MKIFNLLLFIHFTVISFAQSKRSEITLLPIENKVKNLNFFFQGVTLAADVSDTIGMINSTRNKQNIFVVFPQNKSLALHSYLNAQFEQNKSGTPVIMHISKMKLKPIEKGVFNIRDSFLFQCEFYGILDNEKTLLFNFYAKNEFGDFADAEAVMNNYICRALISATEKFKSSFDKKREWHRDFSTSEAGKPIPLKLNVYHNKITSNDSVPCIAGTGLTWAYYQENKKDKTGAGLTKLILTYSAATEETRNGLKLDIYTKAFFHKSRSWKPQNAGDERWLNLQQCHYDICALYGLKLYHAMKQYPFTAGGYKSEMNKIYNEVYSEYTQLRKKLEDETDKGNNEAELARWQTKIKEMQQREK